MSVTTNYKLIKPDQTEFYDIAIANGNCDKIDMALTKKVDSVAGKGLSSNDFTTTQVSKLNGIATGANNYLHPSSHPASIVVEDSTHRFCTDAEKSNWDSKANGTHHHDAIYPQKANVYTKLETDQIISESVPSIPDATASQRGMMTTTQVGKLNGIAANANNYQHPSSHAASMITPDSTHRFCTDSEKSTWNGKANGIHDHDGSYLGVNSKSADSSKLNGQLASYYLNYDNQTNKPTIPTASSIAAKELANTASSGYSSSYSRTDHVHPFPTCVQLGAQTKITYGVNPPASSLGSDGDIYIQY